MNFGHKPSQCRSFAVPMLTRLILLIGFLVAGICGGSQIESTKGLINFVELYSGLFAVTSAQAETCLNLHVIDNRPLGFEDENGQPTGVHWEFLTALEARSDLCINKSLFPYSRIWKSIKFGSHDGGIIFRSSDRNSLVDYVAPILAVQTVVIPQKGVTIKEYQDLKGLTVGKVRGTRLSKQFDTDDSINKLEMNSYDQVFKTIKLKRIDAMAGSWLGLSPISNSDAADYVDIPGKLVIGKRVQWLQISKKSQHIDKIPILRKAVEELVSEGVFDAIMIKYYGSDWKLPKS